MDKVRIQYLMHVYQNQQATPEEKEELLQWYRDVSYKDGEYPDSETAVELRILSRLLVETGYEPKRSWRSRLPWKGVAAAILTIMFLGFLYFINSWNSLQNPDKLTLNDIEPGGNRATLVLTDGRTIDLSSEQGEIVVGHEIKYKDGSSVIDESTSYATLITPRGGQYQITLPDGTKVWLNADSKLKYPSRFEEYERVVELEGEAFFDVKKSDDLKVSDARNLHNRRLQTKPHIPFIVKTPKQVIEVLGTQFNISAYPEDAEVRATLVEGRVKVAPLVRSDSYPRDRDFTLLNPNQQSVFRNGQVVRNDVDVDPYVSWKDGRFSFEGKTFAQVMNELARWYAIEVVYDDKIPEIEFFGGAYRSDSLSLVLRMMESADLQYTLEGRRLTISSKKQERIPVR